MDLRGKVAVVTGAGGGGSGTAEARRFAREGALVVVSDINEAGGRETVRLIEADGGRAVFFRADVGMESDIKNLIAFAESTYGGLDILVNNASGPPVLKGPLEDWFEVIRIDLLGAMWGTLYGIHAMQRRGGGAIVNIGSTSALGHGRKHSKWPGYDVAKMGITRLTTTLAWLRESDNIRVNCLVPDWTASPEVKAYFDSLTPAERQARGAPAVLTALDEIADAVVRLVTDESLAGRILVFASGESPRFIPWADPGYAALE